MSSLPTLSFVIPARNAEAWLPEAISSCLSQSLTDVEVVPVDDRSRDDTWRIMRWYASKDKRVRPAQVLEGSRQGGRGFARNFGCECARAEWLAVLDADDVAERERARLTLKALADPMVPYPALYLYGQAAVIDALSRPMGQLIEARQFDLERARQTGLNGIVHSTAAYHRSVWEAHRYDEGEYAELGLDDWHMQRRVAEAGIPFVVVREPLAGYRIREGAVTAVRDEEKVWELKERFSNEVQAA